MLGYKLYIKSGYVAFTQWQSGPLRESDTEGTWARA